MVDFDYTKLSRQQKLAVFLIVIGPEAAAEVLRHFEDMEIELLCREMSNFTSIPAAVQKQTMEEFASLVASERRLGARRLGYAQRTLEIAKGDYKASAILGRVGPRRHVGRRHQGHRRDGGPPDLQPRQTRAAADHFVSAVVSRQREIRRGLSTPLSGSPRGSRRAPRHDREHVPRARRQNRQVARQTLRHQDPPRFPPQRRRPRGRRPPQPTRQGDQQEHARPPRRAERHLSAPRSARSSSASRISTASNRPTSSACCAKWIRRTSRFR
jgi:hypothetical protein